MINWILGLVNSVANVIPSAIRGWVSDLVNGVYSFFHTVFTAVGGSWARFVNTADSLWRQFRSFADAVYGKFYQLVRITVPAIIHEYRTLIASAESFIQRVLNQAAAWYDAAINWASSLYRQALAWVIANVWNPLKRDLLSAWQWITGKGETLWYYITHPDKLVDLIFDSLIARLESDAWNVADLLGKFFLSLIAKNLVRFAALIEDILNAIL